MWETLLKVVAVYLSSAVKFILGPGVGLAERLHFATTVIATIAGMMTTVVCITYFGGWLRKRFGKKKTKLFRSAEERRRRERWKKYGLVGIAALTPCDPHTHWWYAACGQLGESATKNPALHACQCHRLGTDFYFGVLFLRRKSPA